MRFFGLIFNLSAKVQPLTAIMIGNYHYQVSLPLQQEVSLQQGQPIINC